MQRKQSPCQQQRKKLNFSYTFENVPHRNVTACKYLGILISYYLNLTAHVEYITKKALSKLFFLTQSLHHSTPETKLLAYVMRIRPIFKYANVAWFPFTDKNMGALGRVQQKAVRFIYNSYRRTDSLTALLQRADLSTLARRAKLHRLKFLYMLLRNSFKINPASYVKVNFKQ